jgi:DNA polymerase-3 subunit alpha
MIKNKIKKETASKIWNWILPFARYGFNKSHSACYATIAYQTAYLKANYPVEFMAALLTSEKADTERIGFLIEECKKMKIEVLAPDINESFRNFSVIPKENKVRFGLFAIKNVGEHVVNSILEERKENGNFKSIHDFVSRVDPQAINKKSLESLIRAGVFDRFEERNKLLENLETLLDYSKETQKINLSGQKTLFDGETLNSNLTLKETPPATKRERLDWEKELLGLYVTSHPLEDYRKVLEKKAIQISKLTPSLNHRRIRIGGIISRVKKIITKNGKPMLFVSLEDLSSKIEVVVFPGVMEKNPAVFRENKVVLIHGKLDNRDDVPKLICDSVEEIVET